MWSQKNTGKSKKNFPASNTDSNNYLKIGDGVGLV